MTDLLKNAAEWLDRQQASHLSRQVRYRRGDAQLDILARIGRTVFEVDSGTGVLERIESRDYLIAAVDLVFGGQVSVPQPGDQILETSGPATLVYEVMAPGREPAWRYSDPYRVTLRVHTKQVEEN
ncbi:MAG: hypothetical protein GXX96_25340 [Planctomycetaceae bacterium]|nr:hypothetical protein [Planctomycetaceae bacterium]